MIYALMRRNPRRTQRRRWIRYALCGNAAILERVVLGQPDPKEWKVVSMPGSIRSAWLTQRSTALALLLRRAG